MSKKTVTLDKDALLVDMCERFPGREFTQEDIADYVGCQRQSISRIELRAMDKLRQSLNCDILADLGGLDGELGSD